MLSRKSRAFIYFHQRIDTRSSAFALTVILRGKTSGNSSFSPTDRKFCETREIIVYKSRWNHINTLTLFQMHI